MPLRIEIDRDGEWILVNYLLPGDQPGSMSDTNLLLGRTVILFQCGSDDKSSLIVRSHAGIDATQGMLRTITSLPGEADILATLTHGQYHDMKVMTDVSPAPRTVRFSHHEIDYGTRRCLICDQTFSATIFGQHVIAHPDEVIEARWPGGARGMLEAMAESLETSIAAARDYPRIVTGLGLALAAISEMHSQTPTT